MSLLFTKETEPTNQMASESNDLKKESLLFLTFPTMAVISLRGIFPAIRSETTQQNSLELQNG